MKRFVLVCFSVALLSVCFAVTGSAEGKMGIGYNGDVGGISLKKWVSDDWGWQGILGLNFETAGSGAVAPNDETDVDYDLAFRLFKSKDVAEKVKLNCFAGIHLEHNGSNTKDVGQTNFHIEAGLSPEIFLFENLSVETSMGVRLSMCGETFKDAEDDFVEFGTFGAGVSIVDGLCFNYYF